MEPLYGEEEDFDYNDIPLWGEGYPGGMEETETDRRIRECFGPETDEEVRMKTGGMEFTLVRISPEDSENMERFRPYCEGSPEGKYGVVWKAGCLEDRYVFDTREYAVDFIVMSGRWGEEKDSPSPIEL